MCRGAARNGEYMPVISVENLVMPRAVMSGEQARAWVILAVIVLVTFTGLCAAVKN